MTKQLNTTIDRHAFTEKNIDDLYELKCITTEQMWQLREAYDTWVKAIKRYKDQSGVSLLIESFSSCKSSQYDSKPKSSVVSIANPVTTMQKCLATLKDKKVPIQLYNHIKRMEQKLSDIIDAYNQL